MPFRKGPGIKSVHIDGIGEVVFEYSRRAKHINLSVKPFKGVRVAVPLRVSLRQAEVVARARAPWLRVHLGKIAEIERQAVAFDQHHKLNPAAARRLLRQRVQQLATAHGFEIGMVSIRRQKTRWGSCSSKNNINLNIRAAQLPAELRDYLIFHELVHTRIRNHSRQFWMELGKYLPCPRQTDRELNRYGFLLAL